MIKTILLLLTITIYTSAQDKIKDISIIAGEWKLENDNYTLYEEWKKNNDSVFTGISYTVTGGEKKISENLYILKLKNHFVYIAQPGENNPTLFTLINSDNNKFVFENQEHDFPQRIIYNFVSDSLLTASIEGEINGTLKRKEFPFKRVR